MNTLNPKQLRGLSEENLQLNPILKRPLHSEIIPELLELRERSMTQGFELAIASGFRSYARQKEIWDAKALGQRQLLDTQGQSLDVSQLAPRERVLAILRWSALPGCSRHHWGTDFDVYDLAHTPADYKLELTPQEVAPKGIHGAFHLWLDQELQNCDFFRPYEQDRGGVAPEKWHLSYAPLSQQFAQAFSFEFFLQTIEESDIELKSTVIENAEEIYERFILIKA